MLREDRMTSRARTAGDEGARLHWYYEVATVLVFYVVYSVVRNSFGSSSVRPDQALDNALRVIDVERALGLFFEPHLQDTFIGWGWFLRLWNIFYSSLHFVVTGGVMIFLYRRYPGRYRVMRTTLGFTTGLALLGFSLFPLMPPRLLNDFGVYGGRSLEFDFVDTLAQVGGLWSFNSDAMQTVSNQYAAMPSLHIGWSLWCVLAVWPVLTSRWARRAFAVYPAITLFAIVVTANHFWLDAVGGAVVLLVGWRLAVRFEVVALRFRSSRRAGGGTAGSSDDELDANACAA
ncbi:MAG: PAP2 family protein [Acidimicrobiia bacterium]|nr:PAP2 family protein [Acidimicrobiia bacterium]